MAGKVERGQIWLCTFRPPDKRRPVLVLTRQDALRVLHNVTVAPVTSKIRGAPSEVLVGVDEGLKVASAVSLDNLQTVQRSRLENFVGTLGDEKMTAVCQALAIALGCD